MKAARNGVEVLSHGGFVFERYTEKARRVIYFALHEASQSDGRWVEPHHLLLAILREDRELVARLLNSTEALEEIRKQFELQLPREARIRVDLPLSPESKRVLAYGAEEADRLKHRHITAGHLLLGLLREDKSVAAELLLRHGLRLANVRKEISGSQETPGGTSL